MVFLLPCHLFLESRNPLGSPAVLFTLISFVNFKSKIRNQVTDKESAILEIFYITGFKNNLNITQYETIFISSPVLISHLLPGKL